MKQFTRRNSSKQQQQQTASKDDAQQATKGQPPPAVAADPYSFDIDESQDTHKHTVQEVVAQDQLTHKKPCNSTAATALAALPHTHRKAVAACDPPTDRAAHANNASSKQRASSAAAPHHSTAAPNNRPQQVPSSAAAAPPEATLPAAPSSQPAAETSRRAECAAGSGGRVRAAASGGAASNTAATTNTSNSNKTSNPNPNKKAAPRANASRAAGSGGNSKRPSVTGTKRGRAPPAVDAAGSQQVQQQQQQPLLASNSSSPQGVTPASFTSPAGPSASGPGAISLPTPHRRPRLAAGLLAAAGTTEGRPAQTVMEAQERGELVQMQDDASYAMDGLAATCSIDTQRDSAVTLTEMLSTRKGRVALRADGLAQQFLTNLAKLKAAKDCVLDLCATLSLWLLSSEDANPCYLASVAAAVLLDQLLQYDYMFDDVAAKSAAGARLCRLVRARPLVNVLASTGVNSTRGLLLVALEQATSSQFASKAAAVEKLKHNLRLHGALQRLAGLVADVTVAPGGPVAAAQQLHLLLLVLENATFTCPENGAALVDLQVTPGSKSKGSSAKQQPKQQQQQSQSSKDQSGTAQQSQPFPAVLVAVAQQLLQGVDQEQSRAALHVVLSVLMNLIHGNRAGGALIYSVGGMDVAADIYTTLLQGSAGRHDVLCSAVLQHLDLLSVALGVLINLVSNEPQHSRKLAAAQPVAAAAAPGDSSGSSTGVCSFVQLLCTVVSALGQLLQQHMDQEDLVDESQQRAAAPLHPPPTAGKPSPSGTTAAAAAGVLPSSGVKVVTSPTAAAEALGSDTASEASIVEVYSGMLLGFLVRDGDPALAQAVAAQLPGNSLEPLTSATGRCLDFYVRTGAITEHTRGTLEELLRHLVAVKAGLQPAGVEGSAPQHASEPPPQPANDDCMMVE